MAIDRQLKGLTFVPILVQIAANVTVPTVGDTVGAPGVIRYFRIQNKIPAVNIVLNFSQYGTGSGGVLILPNTEWISDFMFPYSETIASVLAGPIITISRADAANFGVNNFAAVAGYGN